MDTTHPENYSFFLKRLGIIHNRKSIHFKARYTGLMVYIRPRRLVLLGIVLGLSLFASGFTFISPAHAAASLCPFAWNKNLHTGSTGDDVLALQRFLNTEPALAVALSGAGSAGQETSRFGVLTKAAVVKFQEKYAADILIPNALTKGTGIAGTSTRAKLNALCGSPFPTPVSESSATISANTFLKIEAAAQPSAGIAPSFALYVPFTRIKLTAGDRDVTVSRMVVKRVGGSVDQDFANVDLLDEDGSEISFAYLRSDHTAVFKDPFVVPAGMSKVVTLAGDMDDLTDHNGEIAGLELVSVEADAPVSAFIPITGAFQTMNSTLAIGVATATLSPDDPQGNRTRYITDTGIVFSGIRITAGSPEDLRLDSITWEQTGTAGAADIANIQTVVNGVSYPAEVDGRFYTSIFPNGFMIRKGDSLNVAVKGDLGTTGSNRTVKFDINDAADVYLTGTAFGFGIYMIPEDHTDITGNSIFTTLDGTPDTDSVTPFFSGSTISISPGAFTSIGR
jgi:hypothetical protein